LLLLKGRINALQHTATLCNTPHEYAVYTPNTERKSERQTREERGKEGGMEGGKGGGREDGNEAKGKERGG